MSYADGLLATGERIVRRERQHWMFPLLVAGRWVAIAIGIAVVGFVLVQFVLRPSGEGGVLDDTVRLIQNVVGILTWLALAFAVIGLVWSAVRWLTQEYVLTDRRVMHIYGVVNKQALDSSLENITDAQIKVPWLGRIMGFGNLTLMTPAESGINELRLLRDPIEFKKDMMDAKNSRLIDINTPRFPTPPVHAVPPLETAAPGAPVAAPAVAGAAVAAAPVAAPASTPMAPAGIAPAPPMASVEVADEASGWLGAPQTSAPSQEPPVPIEAAAPQAPGPVAGIETAPAAAAPSEPAAPETAHESGDDVTRTLAALADLRDRGAITVEEYEAKKRELLERL